MHLVSGSMADDDAPISWMTLAKGTDVYSSDDQKVGEVGEVVADRQKDIFSGVTLSGGLFGSPRFVAADLIEGITDSAVRLSISSEEADKLDEYEG